MIAGGGLRKEYAVMERIAPTLKVIVLAATIVLGLIAIFYVLGVFAHEHVKELILKTMAIIGILTGVSLVAILVTGSQTKQ